MDYSSMLSQLLFNNPQGALDLAKGLVSAEGGPLIDIQATAEPFSSSNRVQRDYRLSAASTQGQQTGACLPPDEAS
eukprot:g9077.t1 g9077   contig34:796757-796984(-)